MIKIGDTCVMMNFDSGMYKGKFSITHPKLFNVTTEEGNPIQYREALEIAIASVVESIMINKSKCEGGKKRMTDEYAETNAILDELGYPQNAISGLPRNIEELEEFRLKAIKVSVREG